MSALAGPRAHSVFNLPRSGHAHRARGSAERGGSLRFAPARDTGQGDVVESWPDDRGGGRCGVGIDRRSTRALPVHSADADPACVRVSHRLRLRACVWGSGGDVSLGISYASNNPESGQAAMKDFVATAFALWLLTVPAVAAAQEAVFVVRHAERADTSTDSLLSAAGECVVAWHFSRS